MELRQLRYFVAAAEALNFSEASKKLCITQSTLSQQIATLEQELGQRLLERNSHRMRLTEAGSLILPLARQTLRDADHCSQKIQELKGLLTGKLDIGITFSFSGIVTETVMEFMKEYPQVKMNIYYATMDSLMGDLLHHKLDFVLAYRPTKVDPRIESRRLFSSRLSAIVSEGHPLAGRSAVSIDELGRYNLALPLRGMQARNSLDDIAARCAAPMNVRVEAGNVGLLFRIIRESSYATVLSAATVKSEPDLRAIPIDAPGSEMVGCVHLLKDSYVKHSAREFIQRLAQSVSVYTISL